MRGGRPGSGRRAWAMQLLLLSPSVIEDLWRLAMIATAQRRTRLGGDLDCDPEGLVGLSLLVRVRLAQLLRLVDLRLLLAASE
jgi:hypothetical protein